MPRINRDQPELPESAASDPEIPDDGIPSRLGPHHEASQLFRLTARLHELREQKLIRPADNEDE